MFKEPIYQPPQKRPRSEEPESKEGPTRHPIFWFPDGSVVLQVQNTLFRVHRTILCSYSEVFSGMFDIPQPEVIEQYDDCPLIHLQDELSDFEAFMNVLYDALWLDHAESNLTYTISFLMSILKISNKYGCHKIRKKAITMLKQHIPTDISQYEKIHECKKLPPTILIRLLSVAREINVRIFMPCTYLILATRSPSHIIGLMRKLPGNVTVAWEDAAICLAGRTTLLLAQFNDVFKFAVNYQPSPGCEYLAGGGYRVSRPCRPLMMRADQLLAKLNGYTKWHDSWGETLCGPCKAHAKEIFYEGQRKYWNMIPQAFELGSWENLKREAQNFE
ncbi:hypothetical protein BDQ17DRAFT_1474250 [Cyathus striatus]|nr:hypothetical protein BDQ17DRAFT_1474250 [Cyathus striatus]